MYQIFMGRQVQLNCYFNEDIQNIEEISLLTNEMIFIICKPPTIKCWTLLPIIAIHTSTPSFDGKELQPSGYPDKTVVYGSQDLWQIVKNGYEERAN